MGKDAMDQTDLIIERVKQFSLTDYLEKQGIVPKFSEFRFDGRDFLASHCPFQGEQDLPFFWVYKKTNVDFYFCDDCNSQGSVLDFFNQFGYSSSQIQRLLGLEEKSCLEEALDNIRKSLFTYSDEGDLPSLTRHDFVFYDFNKKVYYIGGYPYPESPVYQRLKGKVLTDLSESVRDIDALDADYLRRNPIPEKEVCENPF